MKETTEIESGKIQSSVDIYKINKNLIVENNVEIVSNEDKDSSGLKLNNFKQTSAFTTNEFFYYTENTSNVSNVKIYNNAIYYMSYNIGLWKKDQYGNESLVMKVSFAQQFHKCVMKDNFLFISGTNGDKYIYRFNMDNDSYESIGTITDGSEDFCVDDHNNIMATSRNSTASVIRLLNTKDGYQQSTMPIPTGVKRGITYGAGNFFVENTTKKVVLKFDINGNVSNEYPLLDASGYNGESMAYYATNNKIYHYTSTHLETIEATTGDREIVPIDGQVNYVETLNDGGIYITTTRSVVYKLDYYNNKTIVLGGYYLSRGLSVDSENCVYGGSLNSIYRSTPPPFPKLLKTDSQGNVVFNDEDLSHTWIDNRIIELSSRESGIASVTGELVDNTDPKNPVILVPSTPDIPSLDQVLTQGNISNDKNIIIQGIPSKALLAPHVIGIVATNGEQSVLGANSLSYLHTKTGSSVYIDLVRKNTGQVRYKFNDAHSAYSGGEYTIATTDDIPTTKVLKALVSQNGTNAPTLTILKNTTGLIFTTTYNGVGNYSINCSTPLEIAKTILGILPYGGNNGNYVAGIAITDGGNGIGDIQIYTSYDNTNYNDLLSNSPLTIEMY